MARVTVDDRNLGIEIEGFDKVLAFKSRITVPLGRVRGATPDPGIMRERKGWNGPGGRIPGFVAVGTFHRDGERTFWDVHNPQHAIVIELDDDRYRRLIIEVDDPIPTVDAINTAIARNDQP